MKLVKQFLWFRASQFSINEDTKKNMGGGGEKSVLRGEVYHGFLVLSRNKAFLIHEGVEKKEGRKERRRGKKGGSWVSRAVSK